MRKVVLAAVLVLMAGGAQALLIDRGDGFIYDDVQDITWAQNANINGPADWASQMAWAAGYSQTHSVYGTFDDWRLASMDVNGDDTIVNCSSATEAACQDNEYGYMYFQNGVTPALMGLFTNVQSDLYWSSTEWASNTSQAWYFRFNNSGQFMNAKIYDNYAWAVMDGDVVPVPEPSTALLLSLGLVGLASRRRV